MSEVTRTECIPPPGPTSLRELQPLVHEVYLCLETGDCDGRDHFFAAATAMRHILVESARPVERDTLYNEVVRQDGERWKLSRSLQEASVQLKVL